MNVEMKIEKYKFLRLYDIDFEMALRTIAILKRYRKKDVKYALLRDIVTTYARPFTESKGFKINTDRHGVKFQNDDMKNLHDELMDIRMQIFAHTDLTYRHPKVANWSSDSQKWFPMSFRAFDYNNLISRVEEIKKLIKYVRQQLKEKLAKCEESF